MLFKLKLSGGDKFLKPRLGRWSSLGCYLFSLLALVLLASLLISLWPIVDIKLTPQTDNLHLTTSLHISLDVADSTTTWLVTGRQLQAGEDWVALKRNGYDVYSVGKQNIVVASEDLYSSVDKFISQNIPADYLVVPPTLRVTWQEHIPDKSERGLTLPVDLSFSIYRRFPVADWKSSLAGLSFTDALEWLHKQTGVKYAEILIHPYFLSKVRQKLPNNPNLIRFKLDIDGKTSILE